MYRNGEGLLLHWRSQIYDNLPKPEAESGLEIGNDSLLDDRCLE